MSERRLIAISTFDAERLEFLAEVQLTDGSGDDPRGDFLRRLAARFEDGIDEATVIGSYLCQGCHDKLREAFKEAA